MLLRVRTHITTYTRARTQINIYRSGARNPCHNLIAPVDSYLLCLRTREVLKLYVGNASKCCLNLCDAAGPCGRSQAWGFDIVEAAHAFNAAGMKGQQHRIFGVRIVSVYR